MHNPYVFPASAFAQVDAFCQWYRWGGCAEPGKWCLTTPALRGPRFEPCVVDDYGDLFDVPGATMIEVRPLPRRRGALMLTDLTHLEGDQTALVGGEQ